MASTFDDRPGRSTGLEFALELWTRRRWVAIFIFSAAFAAAVSFAIWLPDVYRATTTVLVESQQVSEEFVRAPITAGLETRIETIQQQVLSRGRLADLIQRLDLYADLRNKGVSFDDLVERLRRDIRLQPTVVEGQAYGGTRTIGFAISYSGRDPQIVADVANLLASLYVVENTKLREGQAMRTAEFLKQQLDEIKSELDVREQRVSGFNLSHIGELPQQIEANLATLERLNTQLRLNGDNQVRAMDRRDRLEQQMADTPIPAGGQPNGPTPAAEQLAKLQQQLDELKRRYTDQYPEVVRVQSEIAVLERQAAVRATATGSRPVGTSGQPADPRSRLMQAVNDVNQELTALRAEESALENAVRGYEQRVENVPKRQEEFQALSRDYQETKDRYDTMLKRYEEAQLASSLEQGQSLEQLRILDAALPPGEPAAPSRSRFLLVGLAFAIGLAVGGVLLVEKFDTAFHSIGELQAFVTVPTLFSIPRITTAAETRRTWRQTALTAVAAILAVSLIAAGSRQFAMGNERVARVIPRERM